MAIKKERIKRKRIKLTGAVSTRAGCRGQRHYIDAVLSGKRNFTDCKELKKPDQPAGAAAPDSTAFLQAHLAIFRLFSYRAGRTGCA